MGPFTGIDEVAGRGGMGIFSRKSRNQAETGGYKTPLVAVQFDFSDPAAKNTDALFHCLMFDRNMEIEIRRESYYFNILSEVILSASHKLLIYTASFSFWS